MKRFACAACFLLLLLTMAVRSEAEDAKDAGKEDKKEEPKKTEEKKDPKTMTADELEAASLCPVKKIESKQIYHYDLNGKTYHFCCRKCQDEFAEHPEKYGAKPETDKK